MGIFDSILGIVAGPIISGITNTIATDQVVAGQEANIAATQLAIDELRAGKEEALLRIDTDLALAMGFIDKATAEAIAVYQELFTLGEGGIDYYKDVVGQDTSQLTPAQQKGLEDVIEQVNTQLATSGLRGAGASGQAVLAETIVSYTAQAIEDNQARADLAAGNLANISLAGLSGEAQTEAAKGADLADITLTGTELATNAITGQTGEIATQIGAIGDIEADIGEVEAGGTLDIGESVGTAIGEIGGLLATEEKLEPIPHKFEGDEIGGA